jgi:adenosine deaminase
LGSTPNWRTTKPSDEGFFIVLSSHIESRCFLELPVQTENNWFQLAPKVELHLHLEGAIPPQCLWGLIRKYGGDPEVEDLQALKRRFEYRDFEHFIDVWTWKNRFLREYEDFTRIAESVAEDLKVQNIRYAEVTYSPSDFFRHKLGTQRITEAVRAGLSRVAGVEVALIADLVRDFGPEKAGRTLFEVNEVREMGVIGVGLGGSESRFPPEMFVNAFRKAGDFGFHITVHAGEAAGPASVWSALKNLGAERIGHGTRAAEDPVLLDYLAKNRIPLEVCPVSNIRTGIVPSIEKHPVRIFFDKGIPISISTDDPRMFGNSLAEEFELLETRLGFSRENVRALILQGIRTSWLPEERKTRKADEFIRNPAWT